MVRQVKSAAAILAAGIVASSAVCAQAATVTPVVSLDFTNPTIGTYGADPAGTSLPAGTSAATYSEAGAVYGSSNYVYTDTGGNGPVFANGMMTTTPTIASHDPGMSVSPNGTYNLTQNFVLEAEIIEKGAPLASDPAIIQWEIDGGTSNYQRIDLDVNSSGQVNGNTDDSNNPNNPSVTATSSLTTGVETHIALVYSYAGTSNPSTLTLYQINDQTGQATVLGTTSVTETDATLSSDALNSQIGILNTPESGAGSGQPPGGRGFNGSADSIYIGTWTGTFNPSDAFAGGDFQLVPEPASLSLIGIGSAMMLLRRRKCAGSA